MLTPQPRLLIQLLPAPAGTSFIDAVDRRSPSLSLWSPGAPAGAETLVWVLGCRWDSQAFLCDHQVGRTGQKSSYGCWGARGSIQVFLCGHLMRRPGQKTQYGCWGAPVVLRCHPPYAGDGGEVLIPHSIHQSWRGSAQTPCDRPQVEGNCPTPIHYTRAGREVLTPDSIHQGWRGSAHLASAPIDAACIPPQ